MIQRSVFSKTGYFSIVLCVIFSFTLCHIASSADWPTYRSDITRSGVTDGSVPAELGLQWQYIPTHAPKPAWPMPSEERPRMHVDNAYYAVMAEDTVYFGSSVTNKIHAIDAASGKPRWTFFTQGPVRFAPTIDQGRLYAGSDDGHVYCLDAEDGSLIWKYRAGPTGEKVLGNGRMISLWPVRTSVLVDGGVVFFAAGVFPYEGLYICALNADDGSEVWKNDTIGDRAHELEFGGISPHGYLVASKEAIYVPNGRSMPAAFDRQTGEFLFNTSPGGKRGGVWALLDNDRLISGVDYSGTPHKVAYNAETGRREGDVFAWFPGIDMAVTPDVTYILTLDSIYAVNRAAYANAVKETAKLVNKRKTWAGQITDLRKKLTSADEAVRKQLNKRIDSITKQVAQAAVKEKQLKNSSYRWRYPAKEFCSLILAGETVFAGGSGIVTGIDAKTGKEIWKHSVQGNAVGLAASDGRLTVSSDEGPIYCFAGTKKSPVVEIKQKLVSNPYPKDEHTETYQTAAEKILTDSDIRKGYCLVLDCGEGRLAYELAKRTELQIVGIESDPAKLATARKRLEAAGLLGARVVVEPWGVNTLPDYFANLLVSDSLLITGQTSSTRETASRLIRPWGGTACLSFHSEDKMEWRKFVRPGLKGAGDWSQQYGDPQNTACSGDRLVNGPLGVLWFGEPGPQGMVERHGRSQSPVAMDGRLFMEGENLIMAADAFNGTLLWKREIPGAVRVKIKADSGNLVVTKTGLYIAARDKCYRLDPATGETIREYTLPRSNDGTPRRWGYISVIDNILYGSSATPMNQYYGETIERFIKDGQWKKIEDVPAEFHEIYKTSRKMYPTIEDVRMASQRSGALYRYMTSFASNGEFTQKNSVSKNLMTCDKVFAMDTETGEMLWDHDGQKIANITIVLGDGKIFFADSTASDEQRAQAMKSQREMITKGVYKEREGILEELHAKKAILAERKKKDPSYSNRTLAYLIDSLEAELYKDENPEGSLTPADSDIRIVTALDARTGEALWSKPVDLTGCTGDKMGAAYSKGLLLFFGNHGNHDAWRFREGGMKWRRITAMTGEDGGMKWSRPLNYRTRPVIVGNGIILEPRACVLQTGETVMRTHPITGEEVPWEFLRPGHTCGTTAASADGLFYRSACTAFYDLDKDRGVTIFGAYRPGCAISVIPACGLLLSQEAAAGCTCSYPIRSTLVMKRKQNRTQPWTIYVTPGDLNPVKHFAINLGAVADMKDSKGTVWFGYPNPKTSSYTHFPNYGVKFDLNEKTLPGTGFFSRDHKGIRIAGTDKPWLFTSGCIGMTRCRIPLIDDGDGQEPARYTVRLGFTPHAGDRQGQRVFDIKLQGQTVAEKYDPSQLPGASTRAAIKEFTNVDVKNDLLLELIPGSGESSPDRAPILNSIEIIREEEKKA